MSQSPTVSVVDDDEQVRESLAALIQSMNLDVACYASGREFLDGYVAARPGCVVLDLRMPQVSGLEILDVLSSRGIHVPVIMISGHGDIPAAVSAMKAGAVDFLEKPYRGAVLMERVHRALELDAHHRQAQAERAELVGRYETLTAEEKVVLELTVAGKPDKAIAIKLDLSLRTIQLRRASVMRKINAHSRAELIRLAQSLQQPFSPRSTP
ncbi:MAG: response regulator transcription factor [Planctomycetia bacterium]|nr:response regulator transcription factor [Planctomycetia bacterium]